MRWWRLFQAEGMRGLYNSHLVIQLPFVIPLLMMYWMKLSAYIPAGSIPDPFFLKILPALFDIAACAVSALYVLWVSHRKSLRYGPVLAALIVFQPATAFVSAAWGQTDSMYTFFLLTGCITLVPSPAAGTVLIILACLSKPQAVIILPVVVFTLFIGTNWLKKMRVLLSVAVLAFGGVLLVQALQLENVHRPFIFSIGQHPVVSKFAPNLWWLFFGEQSVFTSDTPGSPLSYRMSGYILFGISLLPALAYLFRIHSRPSQICLAAAYVYLAWFSFSSQMHERYLFPAVVLLGIGALEARSLLYIYGVLTATLLLSSITILLEWVPFYLTRDTLFKICAAADLACLAFLALFLILRLCKNRGVLRSSSLAVLAAGAFLISPCRCYGGEKPLTFGFIAPLSGTVQGYGIAAQNGFELALEETGRDWVKVIYEDDQFKAPLSVLAFQKLTESDQAGLVACLGSATCSALSPVTRQKQVPLIAWASDPSVAKGNPWVVRLNISGEKQGMLAGKEALRKGYRRAAFITAVNDYSTTFKSGFMSVFPGENIAVTEEILPDAADFRSIITRIRESKVDAIGTCLRPGQIGAFARQARESKLVQTIFGCEVMQGRAEIELARGGLEGGWCISAHVDPSFVQKYSSRFKNDDYISTAAAYYDLAFMLSSAWRKKPDTRAVISTLMGEKRQNGAMGSYGFISTEGEQAVNTPSDLIEVKGNGFRVIDTVP